MLRIEEIEEKIRGTVLVMLGPNPTFRERRIHARALENVADTLRELAEAQARDRPRRGGTSVRIVLEGKRIQIQIGRILWYEMGRPERLILLNQNGVYTITAVSSPRGYAVNTNGIPRFSISITRTEIQAGRYEATIDENKKLILSGPNE